MRFRRAAPTALIVTIVAVVATMTFVANRLFSGLTVAVEEGQYALMRSSVEASLRDEESRAVARAEIVAAIPAIRSAFAARDRPRLLAETEEMFRVQHDRFGVDQMSFHVAPATVYLRVHNPGRSGDDVGAARPMVTVANLTHTSQQGLAFSSSTGPGFFGVVPVRDAQGQHVGCFEVGVDVEPEIDALKVKFALDLTLFVDEQQLRTYSTGLRGEVLNDQNRVGRFLKYHSTNWALMQRLVRSTDLARASRPVQYSRSAGGRTYGVVLLPVRSATGTPLGVVAAARDFSATRGAAGRSLVWQLLLGVFAATLLAAMVLIVLRGFLLQPLAMIAGRLSALAAGAPSPPIAGTELYCEEIQALAQSYETMRVAFPNAVEAPGDDDEGGAS